MPHAVRQTDHLQELAGSCGGLEARVRVQHDRKLDVLLSGQCADQVERLEHETNIAIADGG